MKISLLVLVGSMFASHALHSMRRASIPREYLFRNMGSKRKNIQKDIYGYEDPYPGNSYEYVSAKNSKQQKYMNVLNDNDNQLVFAIGPAGTGKTLIACSHAMKCLESGLVRKIIITRPVVPVEEEELGFLPGNINKKMDPWMRPIFDIFLQHCSQKELDRMMYDNIIEIAPLAFMRGRTFKDCIIIGDEMQNSSPSQMLMLLTRLGKNSKMIITGDGKQNDIPEGKNSGLVDIVEKTKRHIDFITKKYGKYNDKSIQLIEFSNKDIERSKIVKRVLDIYNIDNIINANNMTTMCAPIKTPCEQIPASKMSVEQQNNEFMKGFSNWEKKNNPHVAFDDDIV